MKTSQSQRAKPGTGSAFPHHIATPIKLIHLAETAVTVPAVSLPCTPEAGFSILSKVQMPGPQQSALTRATPLSNR
jgi:hypothetical protein